MGISEYVIVFEPMKFNQPISRVLDEARDALDKETMCDGEGTEDLPNHFLLKPSDEYEFNCLLDNIARHITEDDLKRLKGLMRTSPGGKGVGRTVLDEIQSAKELFEVLRRGKVISVDNLWQLQAMLLQIQRIDLFNSAADYARKLGDMIHLFAPNEEPENGFEYVKFHIAGKDFSKYKRKDLEQLRFTVARVLFIPLDFVVISGIEPSSSLLVTIMIPAEFVETLIQVLESGWTDLDDNGVDVVYIRDQSINIHGLTAVEVVESEMERKLRTTFEQLQGAEKKSEELEVELIKLSRALRRVEVSQSIKENRAHEVSSLKSKSYQSLLSTAMREVERQKYDKNVVMLLLEAQTGLLTVTLDERFRLQTEKLQCRNKELEIQAIEHQLERDKAMLYMALSSVPNIEQLFTDHTQQVLKSIQSAVQIKQVSEKTVIELHPEIAQLLEKFSRKLRPKDRCKLKGLYEWNEEEKKFWDGVSERCLALLVEKEIITCNTLIAINSFISKNLRDIGRRDLSRSFEEEYAKIEARIQRRTPIQRTQTKKAFDISVGLNQGIRQDRDAASESHNVGEQLNDVLGRLGKIEDMLEKLTTIPKKSSSWLDEFGVGQSQKHLDMFFGRQNDQGVIA